MIRFPALCLLALATATACTRTDRSDATPPPAAEETTAAFDATRLPAYHWSLAEATDANGTRIDALFPRADKPLQLDFVDGRVGVSNACNSIGGGYTLLDSALTVSQLAMTQMACADAALMQSDTQISQRLEAGGTLRFDGEDTLVYTTTTGDVLRFTGTPTPQTKYGGPGERVFLEVAVQRVPCHHAMIPDHQCLHVREIHYDDNGLRTGEGEWEFFYGDIEGYTHQPGIRNVLRLDRYTVANPPADGSSLAYVLDMVVESEAVQP